MISKPFIKRAVPKAPRNKAGYEGEKQMAYYLERAFGEEAYIRVFNDLRIRRRDMNAQIDHLVLHRFGFVIIESKSIHDQIRMNAQGEFTRVSGRSRSGMPSPIRQANEQATWLRELLDENKTTLRPMAKTLLNRPIQPDFRAERFRVLVAISNGGRIEDDGVRPDELCKADAVCDKVRETIAAYESTTGFKGFVKYVVEKDKSKTQKMDEHHVKAFTDLEIDKITQFLLNHQVECDAKSIPASRPPKVAPVTNITISKSATKTSPTKAYAAWTADEEQRLKTAFENGISPKEIASEFGRSVGALRARAVLIGLIKERGDWR